MINDGKRRKRVNAVPDAGVLAALTSRNQAGLQMAINRKTLEALAAIEETIAQFSDNAEISFYRLDGQRVYTAASVTAAGDEIYGLAHAGLLLKDPAYTQALIASIGSSSGVNHQIMHQLSDLPQRLFEYQLLGVQMQLAHLLS